MATDAQLERILLSILNQETSNTKKTYIERISSHALTNMIENRQGNNLLSTLLEIAENYQSKWMLTPQSTYSLVARLLFKANEHYKNNGVENSNIICPGIIKTAKIDIIIAQIHALTTSLKTIERQSMFNIAAGALALQQKGRQDPRFSRLGNDMLQHIFSFNEIPVGALDEKQVASKRAIAAQKFVSFFNKLDKEKSNQSLENETIYQHHGIK